MAVLLTSAFCAPVEYYAAIAAEVTLSPDRVIPSEVWLEACENYQKQSWRNRCTICAAGGRENISFPIVHREGSHNNIPITEVEIDYKTDWVTRAERAITSAYSTSAFFEYYKDEFFAILESRPATLFELNLRLMQYFLDMLGIPAQIYLTAQYGAAPEDARDLREAIHPKRENSIMEDLGIRKPYYQVFSGKYGFQYGVSVMDLLFNEGPDALSHLKSRLQTLP